MSGSIRWLVPLAVFGACSGDEARLPRPVDASADVSKGPEPSSGGRRAGGEVDGSTGASGGTAGADTAGPPAADAASSQDASVDVSLSSDAGPDASFSYDATIVLPDASIRSPLSPRVDNITCSFPPNTEFGGYAFPVVYENLTLVRPVWVGTAPGDPDTLFVVEQDGAILSFPKNSDPARDDLVEFLAIDVYRNGNEEGLLGLTFHPDYAKNGRFFVSYSSQDCPDEAVRCSVIAEYGRSATDPRVADPTETRLIVIAQPQPNHNGGALAFGPDGRLYISLGDGGSPRDQLGHAQNTATLLGAISRIDVDTVPAGGSYGIPSDNPFADGMQGAPEVWAWGFRNVWRFSFDRSLGTLWAGDVGQLCFEEIDRVDGPGNYGWRVREAFRCLGTGCSTVHNQHVCPGDFIDPIWDYTRSDGNAVIGGVVYRGPNLDELWGAYLFADHVSNRVWALRETPELQPDVVLLGTTSGGVTSFGEDAAGNVYFTTLDGRIRTLRRTSSVAEPPPTRLSATGCFADVPTLTPAPGVVPYELNVPFWSDGANKRRWWALPAGASANVRSDGTFEFPVGTVFIKHFEVEELGLSEARRLETRFYVRQLDAWRGYTYVWNAAQTDATLLDDSLSETFETASGTLTWNYPSRAQCDNCHTAVAGHVLGFRTRQLDRTMSYAGTEYPQLAALFEAGYTSDPTGTPAGYPRLTNRAEPLAARARAYLDTNCGMCHQPAGPGNAQIDLRFSTPLALTGTCDEVPDQGELGLAEPRIILPGDPSRSVLSARMGRRGEDQMPPLASTVVDAEGVAVIEDWIASLQACP